MLTPLVLCLAGLVMAHPVLLLLLSRLLVFDPPQPSLFHCISPSSATTCHLLLRASIFSCASVSSFCNCKNLLLLHTMSDFSVSQPLLFAPPSFGRLLGLYLVLWPLWPCTWFSLHIILLLFLWFLPLRLMLSPCLLMWLLLPYLLLCMSPNEGLPLCSSHLLLPVDQWLWFTTWSFVHLHVLCWKRILVTSKSLAQIMETPLKLDARSVIALVWRSNQSLCPLSSECLFLMVLQRTLAWWCLHSKLLDKFCTWYYQSDVVYIFQIPSVLDFDDQLAVVTSPWLDLLT